MRAEHHHLIGMRPAGQLGEQVAAFGAQRRHRQIGGETLALQRDGTEIGPPRGLALSRQIQPGGGEELRRRFARQPTLQ